MNTTDYTQNLRSMVLDLDETLKGLTGGKHTSRTAIQILVRQMYEDMGTLVVLADNCRYERGDSNKSLLKGDIASIHRSLVTGMENLVGECNRLLAVA